MSGPVGWKDGATLAFGPADRLNGAYGLDLVGPGGAEIRVTPKVFSVETSRVAFQSLLENLGVM